MPPVSRTLRFAADDALQEETTLNVAADHGFGVRCLGGAESSRKSTIRASITNMEEMYAALTAADDRERRRLTRAALKTRRVLVPSWPFWESPAGPWAQTTSTTVALRK